MVHAVSIAYVYTVCGGGKKKIKGKTKEKKKSYAARVEQKRTLAHVHASAT